MLVHTYDRGYLVEIHNQIAEKRLFQSQKRSVLLMDSVEVELDAKQLREVKSQW